MSNRNYGKEKNKAESVKIPNHIFMETSKSQARIRKVLSLEAYSETAKR